MNNNRKSQDILNQLNSKQSRRAFKRFGWPGILLIIIIAAFTYFFTADDLPASSDDRTQVTVDRYIDGDTTRFYYEGQSESFRYLIIDTPELNTSEDNPEFMAVEAAERTRELLENAEVIEVEFDVGPETDHHGRYLAYVYADDVMINEVLVREGLATVRYLNPPNTTYQKQLEEAERLAKKENLGIWSME